MFWIRENKKQNKGGWRDRESHSKRSRVILFGKKGKTKLLGQRKCWSVIVFTYTWGTEQHQNTVIWRVFQLSWGGQMSVLIRLCVWRCSVVNYIYIYISSWSWQPASPFTFCWYSYWPVPSLAKLKHTVGRNDHCLVSPPKTYLGGKMKKIPDKQHSFHMSC